MARSSYSSRIPSILRSAERRVKAANRNAAENIAQAAEARVPRDSGDTARSIDTSPVDDGHEVTVDFPAHLLEFGTVKMGARPFLTPAAEAEREAHQRAVRKAWG